MATSRTSPYSPHANGQVERLNGTLWNAISLSLKSKGLGCHQWEAVLPDALHSVRSLLCTSTNATPHERFLSFNRRSTSGTSLPEWLVFSDKVLLKKQQRSSKYDPLVEEVELLECNPYYAHVRFPSGKEDTVSVSHLAPHGDPHHGPQQPSLLSPVPLLPDHCDQTTHKFCAPNEALEEANNESIPQEPQLASNSDGVEELARRQQRVRPYHLRNRDV